MPNYLDMLSSYFPGVGAYTTGNPEVYDDIVWVSTPVAQSDLDVAYVVEYKTNKIIEFSEQAREDIINGFDSSSLGTPFSYDSEPEDQLNLIGSVTANVTMPYSCRAYTQGCQHIDVGGNKVGTDSTGYANDLTMYNLEVQVDGTSSYFSFEGQDIQTYDSLISTMNADADFSVLATASLVAGDVEIQSKSFGTSSTISIIVGSLVSTLVGYVGITTAKTGINGVDNSKTYQVHTNAQLLAVLNDGAVVKLSILQKFNTKKEQVIGAADIAAVDAITW
jgi:hypothetical protein